MPRLSKVPPATRRAWLEAHDHGKRLDLIAKEENRTDRTVKAQIERARREREQQEVRTGLLRSAYEKHFEDLVGLVQELRQRAAHPDPHGLWTGSNLRTTMLREALQSHTPKAALWKACQDWDDAAAGLDEVEEDLQTALAERVEVELKPHFPGVTADSFAASLQFAVQETARGGDLSLMRYSSSSGQQGFHLVWGPPPSQTVDYARPAALSPGKETYTLARNIRQERLTALEESHAKLVKELAASDDASQVRHLLQTWQQARDIIEREAEALSLRRMLPGTCSFCPGSESTAAPRVRRPRRRT